MRVKSIFSMVFLAGLWAVSPAQVWAGLVFGPSARTQFEGFRDNPLIADKFIDFNSSPAGAGADLTTQFSRAKA